MTASAQASRGTRTRSALIAAGFELMAERPIDAIPIDDIVAAARVAKGSFFNHFADKKGFADAAASEVRLDIEARVAAANRTVSDPLERLTGGLVVALDYALTEPKRSAVLLRGAGGAASQDHPLNRGVLADLDACLAAGLIRAEAARAGVLFWLGTCQMLMTNAVETVPSRTEATTRMADVLTMALAGLGVNAARIPALIETAKAKLG